MTDRELMQQALEKLEFFDHMKNVSKDTQELITVLRERLAQNVARPCKIGGPCVPTESGPCACRELQQSPAPTTGNVLMDAYQAMQEKKQAARTTDRGPVDSAEKAGAYMDARLWEFIDMAAAWPGAKPDPRTWDHVMVYAPKPAWRDHVEQRLLTWRQSFVNRSGDQLALDDFMDKRSLDDLIDFVCDAYTDLQPVKFNCTVVDDAHPEGVPLSQWGQQSKQKPFCYHDGRNIVGKEYADHSDVFPLYTEPQPEQEPLTEKRIIELYSFWVVDCHDIVGFARAIERSKPQMQPCAGRNCGSTNPNLHSAECFEDYEKSTGMNQWVDLTEEEINNSYMFWVVDQQDVIGFGKSLETKIKRKNT